MLITQALSLSLSPSPPPPPPRLDDGLAKETKICSPPPRLDDGLAKETKICSLGLVERLALMKLVIEGWRDGQGAQGMPG